MRILNIISYGARSGVFVLANQLESHSGDDCKVSFEQVGDRYFLSAIQTLNGAYSLPLPRPVNVIATTKGHAGMSASGIH